jgi:hypothetical protein
MARSPFPSFHVLFFLPPARTKEDFAYPYYNMPETVQKNRPLPLYGYTGRELQQHFRKGIIYSFLKRA